MCSMADIPLNKVDKMMPFLQKHCQQGGALAGQTTLRQNYLPRVFSNHTDALRKVLTNHKIFIVVDETTDIRNKMVLNILFGFIDQIYFGGLCPVGCMQSQYSSSSCCVRSEQLWCEIH